MQIMVEKRTKWVIRWDPEKYVGDSETDELKGVARHKARQFDSEILADEFLKDNLQFRLLGAAIIPLAD